MMGSIIINKFIKITLVFTAFIFIQSCYYKNEQELYGFPKTKECDTTNLSYSKDILPVIQSNCLICHGSDFAATGGNIDLRTANIANVANENNKTRLINSISSATNYSMPKNSTKLNDCEINKLKAWVNKGASTTN
jgi:uncharacterized membrane protein